MILFFLFSCFYSHTAKELLNKNLYNKYYNDDLIYLREPNLLVCSNSSYSFKDILDAVYFWESIGYKFGNIFYNIDCEHQIINFDNSIIITKNYSHHFNDDKALIGLTSLYSYDNIDYIDYIIIQIKENKQNVLEHELGHCLGWRDIPQDYNIMNPEWSIYNTEKEGLENINENI